MYIPVIGLEIHAELLTKSKVFCTCSAEFGGEQNTRCCPVCTGMPGTLPVINQTAVEYAVKAGYALNCDINKFSVFDRKNYFYPDLPKAYQISQLNLPLCINGSVPIEIEEDGKKIQKNILIGSAVVAGVLAATYVGYDQKVLSDNKKALSVAKTNFEKIMTSPKNDDLIKKGSEFTRRSFLSGDAWPNDIRTYVVKGKDSKLIERYGSNVYSFKANKDVRLAGLNSQIGLLSSEKAMGVRMSTVKEYSKHSISSKRFIKKMSGSDFSKLTIEELKRQAWDTEDGPGSIAKSYASLLKKSGYSGVHDVNLPTSAAKILLDQNAFTVKK